MTDSTRLLDDHEALRARFDVDGYVYLRGVIDHGPLLDLRRCITAIAADQGWFRPGTNALDAITCIAPCVEGEERYFAVYDEIQKLEAFHALPHEPGVRRCTTALLGDRAFPHPLSIARLAFPDNTEWSTPPHQDYPNNQGTEDLIACWMPLSDCPTELGSLGILRGSHRLGLVPLEFALGAGGRQAVLDERHEQLDWVGHDLQLGDLVAFHSLTVHRSLPNTTDRLRLSVDCRFQREGEALTTGCLEPHFGRLGWDEIYRGWERHDLERYWSDKEFTVVPWDASLHDLPDEHVNDAIRAWVSWRREKPPPPGDPSRAEWEQLVRAAVAAEWGGEP